MVEWKSCGPQPNDDHMVGQTSGRCHCNGPSKISITRHQKSKVDPRVIRGQTGIHLNPLSRCALFLNLSFLHGLVERLCLLTTSDTSPLRRAIRKGARVAPLSSRTISFWKLASASRYFTYQLEIFVSVHTVRCFFARARDIRGRSAVDGHRISVSKACDTALTCLDNPPTKT